MHRHEFERMQYAIEGTHLGNTRATGNEEARIAPLEEAMLRAPVERK
jgi:hypothetical protein